VLHAHADPPRWAGRHVRHHHGSVLQVLLRSSDVVPDRHYGGASLRPSSPLAALLAGYSRFAQLNAQAILEVGAFITSLACGTLADILGRKKLLFVGALVFSTGGAIQTFTTGYGSMVIGRIVAGFGVGVLR
jgi:MFS family permease